MALHAGCACFTTPLLNQEATTLWETYESHRKSKIFLSHLSTSEPPATLIVKLSSKQKLHRHRKRAG